MQFVMKTKIKKVRELRVNMCRGEKNEWLSSFINSFFGLFLLVDLHGNSGNSGHKSS
jgi:hypothetical protein